MTAENLRCMDDEKFPWPSPTPTPFQTVRTQLGVSICMPSPYKSTRIHDAVVQNNDIAAVLSHQVDTFTLVSASFLFAARSSVNPQKSNGPSPGREQSTRNVELKRHNLILYGLVFKRRYPDYKTLAETGQGDKLEQLIVKLPLTCTLVTFGVTGAPIVWTGVFGEKRLVPALFSDPDAKATVAITIKNTLRENFRIFDEQYKKLAPNLRQISSIQPSPRAKLGPPPRLPDPVSRLKSADDPAGKWGLMTWELSSFMITSPTPSKHYST
ncbi:hypothetical protein JR316_0008309 [Psilocybe cubensis]|uniref:Uncharacterized protein n=1 Tax=Psilocybe cubensis TaxID=181762 RepID=A0ACB8GW65_PSICU|nr:hypothetical protein JR316_0008309 [Psilocybe cubensis]KAH9479714.1 hypothetical protein JR316_0008309 [Psilocybe cubensis]